MSALSSVSSDDAAVKVMLAVTRPLYAAAIWREFHEHEDLILIQVLFYSKRVRDVRWLVEKFAGPEPGA